jgi:hypothetical protein
MYQSTAHFQPLVNGGGWWPNDYWELWAPPALSTARSLRFLRALETSSPEGESSGGMERYRESMPMVFRLGDEAVYEIRESADPS